MSLRADPHCFPPDVAENVHKREPADPILDIFTLNRCPVMHVGYLAKHRQRWISAGTALGEVAYSLSLAPGESRSVAMIDLRRRQQGRRQEDTTAQEQLLSDQDHTFALQEVAAAVALEHQHGKTAIEASTVVTGGAFVAAGALVGGIGGALIGTAVEPGGGTLIGAGLGAGAGAAAGGLVFAGAQAIGMIEAESSGDRDVMAETSQRIAQSTSQQSAMIRSLWSTVVTEDVQDEQFGVRTSNITNYNHMHALNMEYYEILHRYDTLTTLERVVPVLYLPFAALNLDNADLVDEFWDSIRLGLPDDLRDKGDTVFVDPPPPDFVPEPLPDVPAAPAALFTGLRIDVEVQWDLEWSNVITAGPALLLAALNAAFLLPGAMLAAVLAVSDKLFQDARVDLELTNGRFEPLIALPRLDDIASGITTFRFLCPAVDASEVVGVRVELNSPTDLLDTGVDVRVSVDDVTVNGNVDLDVAGTQLSSGLVQTLALEGGRARRTFSWMPMAGLLADHDHAVSAAAAADARNADGEEDHAALLAQLAQWEELVLAAVQREQYRFTRIILAAMEPGRLTYLLDRLHVAGDDDDESRTIPLHRIAHTTPIGVTDDSVLLRMKDFSRDTAASWIGSPEGWDWDTASTLDLFALLIHPSRLRERFSDDLDQLAVKDVVHLPGAGVFAEAVLGRSNAAEYVDPERYWNWQDSPIPHQAPTILPVSTDPRLTAPLPSDPTVPAATLPLVDAPTFPASVGMAGVLQAIQNGNMFRDMSKSEELTNVLGNLAKLAGDTATTAATMTGDAAAEALGSATEIGKTVASMTEQLMANAPSQAASPPHNPTTAAAASKAAEHANDMPAIPQKATLDAYGVPRTPDEDGAPPPPPGLAERPWRPYLDPADAQGPGAVSKLVGGPTPIQAQQTQALLDLLDQAATDTGAMPDTELLLPHLETWYRDSVVPLLVFARHNEEYLGSAIAQYLDWLATVYQLGMDAEGTAMEALHGDGMTLITIGLENAVKAAFGQMEANNDLGYLVDALDWIALAHNLGLDSTNSDFFDANGVADESGIRIALDGPLSPTDGLGLGDSYQLTVSGGLAIGVNQPLPGHVVDVTVNVTNGTATPAGGPLHASLDFTTAIERTDAQEMTIEVVGTASLLQGVWSFEERTGVTIGAV